MGRNAAFGRPTGPKRLRVWWYALEKSTRANTLLALVVGAVSLALVTAATSRDVSRPSPLANATRPQVTFGSIVTTTSTTLLGSLFAAGEASRPADLLGAGSTTSSTVAVATTVTPGLQVRPGSSPVTTTTLPPEPAITVPDPGVVFTEVPPPPPTTTTQATAAPVTTAPVITVPPTTTTPPTTVAAVVKLPPLLGPG